MIKVASFFKEERDPFFKKGIEKGKLDVVENLIVKLGLSDEQTAEVAEVPLAFVQKVRAELARKKE